MTTKLEEIEAEAMKLDSRARALLAQRLTLSLGRLSKREIELLWGREALRRSRQLRDGRVRGLSGAAVLRKARASVARKRSGSTR